MSARGTHRETISRLLEIIANAASEANEKRGRAWEAGEAALRWLKYEIEPILGELEKLQAANQDQDGARQAHAGALFERRVAKPFPCPLCNDGEAWIATSPWTARLREQTGRPHEFSCGHRLHFVLDASDAQGTVGAGAQGASGAQGVRPAAGPRSPFVFRVDSADTPIVDRATITLGAINMDIPIRPLQLSIASRDWRITDITIENISIMQGMQPIAGHRLLQGRLPDAELVDMWRRAGTIMPGVTIQFHVQYAGGEITGEPFRGMLYGEQAPVPYHYTAEYAANRAAANSRRVNDGAGGCIVCGAGPNDEWCDAVAHNQAEEAIRQFKIARALEAPIEILESDESVRARQISDIRSAAWLSAQPCPLCHAAFVSGRDCEHLDNCGGNHTDDEIGELALVARGWR